LVDWTNRLALSESAGADIVIGFVFSTEFDEKSKDDVTFLNVLYSAFFNRTADEGGLTGWLSQLEQGTSREDVLNGFLHSDEFVALAESYGIVAYEGIKVSHYVLSTVTNYVNFGTDISWDTYTYDSKGNLSREIHVYLDGTILPTQIDYTYDQYNNMLTRAVDITYVSSIRYTYIAEGKILTSKGLNGDGTFANKKYTYNANGTISRIDVEASFDTPSSVEYFYRTYTYDSHGNILSKRNIDGLLLFTQTWVLIR